MSIDTSGITPQSTNDEIYDCITRPDNSNITKFFDTVQFYAPDPESGGQKLVKETHLQDVISNHHINQHC